MSCEHSYGTPLAGPIMAAVGFAGWAWTTALKVFFGAAAFAEAVVPSGSWTWDNVTQAVTATLALAGAVWTWHTTARAGNAKIAADAARDIWLRDQMARLQVAQAGQHANISERLDRQDAALGIAAATVPSAPAVPSQDSCQEN